MRITKKDIIKVLSVKTGGYLRNYEPSDMQFILEKRIYTEMVEDVGLVIFDLLKVHKEAKELKSKGSADNNTRTFTSRNRYTDGSIRGDEYTYEEYLGSGVDEYSKEVYIDYFKYYIDTLTNRYFTEEVSRYEEQNKEDIEGKTYEGRVFGLLQLNVRGYSTLYRDIVTVGYWYIGEKECDKLLTYLDEIYKEVYEGYYKDSKIRPEIRKEMRDYQKLRELKLTYDYGVYRSRIKTNPKLQVVG